MDEQAFMLAVRFPANKHLIHKHPGDLFFKMEISVNDTEILPGRGIGLGPGVYEYRKPLEITQISNLRIFGWHFTW